MMTEATNTWFVEVTAFGTVYRGGQFPNPIAARVRGIALVEKELGSNLDWQATSPTFCFLQRPGQSLITIFSKPGVPRRAGA